MSTPDGIEVVATRADAVALVRPPLLVLDALEEFFDAEGLGSGALSWERIGEGHSNLTYLLRRNARSFVLRRGPRPPLPKSTHDMMREARIQQLVGAAGIAVPQIVAVCADESVLGVPFYVMDYLDGVVITNDVPPALDTPAQRRETVFAAVDTLIGLHRVDVTQGGLAQVGRPDGYLHRQVSLFSALWEGATLRSLPEVSAVASWLVANTPTSQRASVVHGDFRLGNLMFEHSAPPRVLAVLDWEMATVGDPLADLGYFTATYAQAGLVPTPLELTTVTRLAGYPTRDELAQRYAAATGVDLSNLRWYQALALWKSAVFCEAIYTRWLNGERPGDAYAPLLEQGVPRLIEAAADLIG
ncbi:phosphotransferase family protein [Glaciibacter psychrotolerans]|uniref:Aminoglycoside phosphotransferase (APT) family kinase protein n=1 Tax=Glaciibacter psychrotolerans TaxID=670054 RepID=A0A7Z0EDV2_9MICO|nr:phosphotransferase family protein [Leifsonia psychrotolerans]NYJ19678.1 aminoglycoside phosphotransferase (APT) family kinase protein [Leifsonia psychrotolerans]